MEGTIGTQMSQRDQGLIYSHTQSNIYFGMGIMAGASGGTKIRQCVLSYSEKAYVVNSKTRLDV